ncbi:MAG: GNAT family N-acetyltransferase [Anaerolineales bacterium]|nr:GNAT family N-acetyltransferase [Anaerolineales bacterium]
MQPMTSTETIFIPEAPAIYGLVFRGFQGASDFLHMAAVIQGSKEFDQLERAETAEDIERNYKHLVNSDPYQDMLFAEIDGQVIGYSRVEWRKEVSGKFVYVHFGFLLPAWRRKGIGRAMLRYNQRRLQEIAAGHPGADERFYESFASSTEHSATALLLDEGYQVVRRFYEMVRPDLEDIPDAPMPSGLEVRPVRPEHYQAIYEASKEAFRDHWGFSEEMEPGVEQWLDDPNFDPSLWRVAWDRDQVAGMVCSFIDHKQNEEYNRKRGWTENICVRRPWRRRGLARSLIVQSFHVLKERGMQEAALGVDTENRTGALRVYESVGFRPVKHLAFYHKPF